ncbi:hypothetical protein [Planktothrix sp.]
MLDLKVGFKIAEEEPETKDTKTELFPLLAAVAGRVKAVIPN